MSQYLTKKELVKEIVKCGKDPVYFIDNYCKIAHPTTWTDPFQDLGLPTRPSTKV